MKNLDNFYRLFGGVRHYVWGQRASEGGVPFIAQLLGEEAGDDAWAGLWLAIRGYHDTLSEWNRG